MFRTRSQLRKNRLMPQMDTVKSADGRNTTPVFRAQIMQPANQHILYFNHTGPTL